MKRTLGVLILASLHVWAPFLTDAEAQVRRVNAPYFSPTVRLSETAIFWFGRVDPSHNYADVRVAYTDSEVWINVAVFDQWLWHDDAASRTPASLETWDAVSVLLDTTGVAPTALSASSHRFVGELSGWRPRTDYQAAYVGAALGWTLSPSTAFTTETNWRGDALNTAGADRGWGITFHIPFASLGLTGPPAAGTIWRLALQVHDKDAQATPAVVDATWPAVPALTQPATWGQLGFGLLPDPTTTTPPSAETHTIRHGLGGAVVTDAMVGGSSTCGEGSPFFSAWGSHNYANSTTLVVQNQADVADWPCFSKFYVDFPMTALPAGKRVVSATLTVYQFGGSDPSQARRSLVQVFTVADAWDEATITWNTAPLAVQNVAQSWVDVIQPPGLPWPGAARNWNLSAAVTQAYTAQQPVLRLALYAADGAYHSGKYFTSSDTGEWNATGRPTLVVVLADSNTPAPPSNVVIR